MSVISSKVILNEVSESEFETKGVISSFVEKLKPSDKILLIGDLGAGKTFTAKTIISKLIGKSRDEITSPTFNICAVYNNDSDKTKQIHHYDLYRLKNLTEAIEAGVEESLQNNNVLTLIEWPEIAQEILPKEFYIIKIKSIGANQRKILIEKY